MEHRASGDTSSAEQITRLRARVAAGERDAAGPLGELLASRGDHQGAIQVWADAYGDRSPGRKRLAELLVREGDLERAVSVWDESAAVWSNPISLYRQYLATLSDEERQEHEYDEPEEMAGTQAAVLVELFAREGEEAVIAQLRAWRAKPGDSATTWPQ
jgi:hypothetical protein